MLKKYKNEFLGRYYRSIVLILAGLTSLVLSVLVVRDKLRDLMIAEPDIFFGPLVALAVFLFTKAFQKQSYEVLEEEAADVVRDANSPLVNMLISQRFRENMDEQEVFEDLARLTRNVDAAISRLNEYYSIRTTDLKFSESMPLLSVVSEDLDAAFDNSQKLRRSLNKIVIYNSDDETDETDETDERFAPVLKEITRSVREAINRRNECYYSLINTQESSGLFDGKIKDLFKLLLRIS